MVVEGGGGEAILSHPVCKYVDSDMEAKLHKCPPTPTIAKWKARGLQLVTQRHTDSLNFPMQRFFD